MSKTDDNAPAGRSQIRNLREKRHDTYKLRSKLPEPTICPECGATYHKGHWSWGQPPSGSVHEHTCPACQRILDHYPAGELTISGAFATAHEEEIVNLAKNIEQKEKVQHPLNRIMAIEKSAAGMRILTTDIHLPRRIAESLEHAWEGVLDMHYDEEGYFIRLAWRRDD